MPWILIIGTILTNKNWSNQNFESDNVFESFEDVFNILTLHSKGSRKIMRTPSWVWMEGSNIKELDEITVHNNTPIEQNNVQQLVLEIYKRTVRGNLFNSIYEYEYLGMHSPWKCRLQFLIGRYQDVPVLIACQSTVTTLQYKVNYLSSSLIIASLIELRFFTIELNFYRSPLAL